MSKQKTQEENPAAKDEFKLDDCFIITPIGEVNSEIYKKTNGLIEAIIVPVLVKYNLKALPAHYIASPGSIPKQIIKHLIEDKLVIANLTGLNPNVMYELAIRHAVKLPLVIMAEHGTKLPFDISDQRTIFYYDTLNGVEDCKPRLSEAIELVLKTDAAIDNPIYDVIKENSILKSTETDSAEKFLINKLDRIENILNNVSFKNASSNSHDQVAYSNKLINYANKFNFRFLVPIEDAKNEVNAIIKKYQIGAWRFYTSDNSLTLTFHKILSRESFEMMVNDFNNNDKIQLIDYAVQQGLL